MLRQRRNVMDLEQVRKSTKTKIIRCKRDLRKCYKLREKFRNMIKQCDEIIKEVEIAVNEERSRDVVDMDYIFELLGNMKRAEVAKDMYIEKIDELKQITVDLENGTYELIMTKGHLLTRDDMVQLTGGHYYNFDKADEDYDADGTFIDYVFVHGVERIYSKHEDDLSFDLKLDMPLFHACMKAIIRKDKDHAVFYGALDMLQEQREQKRIEQLESKYEVDGKIITLK